MGVSVGFVILSHQAGGQLLRLTRRLAAEYNNPPIVCHHDFGQAPLDISAFGDRVRFVRPHLATSWGKLSVVHAVLSAIGSRARELGLGTAMLEHIGSGADDLYKDLTLANVSAWQQYTLAWPSVDDGAHHYTIINDIPVMGSRSRQLRRNHRRR